MPEQHDNPIKTVDPVASFAFQRLLVSLLDVIESAPAAGIPTPDFGKLPLATEKLREASPAVWSSIETMRRQEKALLDQALALGQSPEVVLAKALALFQDAVQAEQRGERLAILNRDDEIVEELTGLSSSPEPASSAAE